MAATAGSVPNDVGCITGFFILHSVDGILSFLDVGGFRIRPRQAERSHVLVPLVRIAFSVHRNRDVPDAFLDEAAGVKIGLCLVEPTGHLPDQKIQVVRNTLFHQGQYDRHTKGFTAGWIGRFGFRSSPDGFDRDRTEPTGENRIHWYSKRECCRRIGKNDFILIEVENGASMKLGSFAIWVLVSTPIFAGNLKESYETHGKSNGMYHSDMVGYKVGLINSNGDTIVPPQY